MLRPVFTLFLLLAVAACGPTPPLSPEESFVVGKWECNTYNGAVWLYTFSRNRKLNFRDVAGSRAALHGTWHVEGTDVVYTVDRDQSGPREKKTTRFPLSELKNAPRNGTDPDARWHKL
jgi:hypothetical protein